MAFFVGHLLFYAQCAEGNPLVYLHLAAENRGFPNHHPGPVVDKAFLANLCPGMDIYPVFPWICSLIIRGIIGTP
jgi:hypothetical protein